MLMMQALVLLNWGLPTPRTSLVCVDRLEFPECLLPACIARVGSD